MKDGKFKRYYIYNVCDHAECYREVRSQAISYTTGVPAMLAAKLLLEGKWKRAGVWKFSHRAIVADWAYPATPSAVSIGARSSTRPTCAAA